MEKIRRDCDLDCFVTRAVQAMSAFKDRSAFAPVMFGKLVTRDLDKSYVTYQDFYEDYYGRHCCNYDHQMMNIHLNEELHAEVLKMRTLESPRILELATKEIFWYVFAMLRYESVKKNIKNYFPVVPKLKPAKILVNDYLTAMKYGVLKTYFGEKDIFEVCVDKDESDGDYDFQVSDDYYDYINNNYYMTDRVEMYKRYVTMKSINYPMYPASYKDPLCFGRHFDVQLEQYIDIFSHIETKGRLYIVGDGPGTASIAAFITGRDYVSFEPNAIGDVARHLGIISTQTEPERNLGDIFILFHVTQFCDPVFFLSERLLILDENFDMKIKDILPHELGGAMLFLRGVKVGPIDSFAFSSPRPFFLRDGKVQAVNPVTVKAEAVCVISKIPLDKKGRPVSTDPLSPHFNLITRNNPKDSRLKGKQHKQVRGNNYKVVKGVNLVSTRDSLIPYEARGYVSSRRLTDYRCIKGFYYVESLRPEKVDGVYDSNNNFIKLYLMYKFKTHNSRFFGVYKRYDTMTAVEYGANVAQNKLEIGEFLIQIGLSSDGVMLDPEENFDDF